MSEDGLPLPAAQAGRAPRLPADRRPGAAGRGSAPEVPTFLTTLAGLLRVFVVGLFLTGFALQTYRIPSASMEPTLQIGDFVVVDKTPRRPEAPATSAGWDRLLAPSPVRRGDLLVFHFPPDPSRELVKRVVGLPGDRLRLHGGRVLVDGSPLAEPYTLFTPAQPEVFRDEFPNLREVDPDVDPRWWRALRRLGAGGEVAVPAGSYFVLGDNRNNSEDSRYWGFVPRALVIGRPALVYFSVPNGTDAPSGGPLDRLRWLARWEGRRIGVLH